jgi:hypothetical protein
MRVGPKLKEELSGHDGMLFDISKEVVRGESWSAAVLTCFVCSLFRVASSVTMTICRRLKG